MKIAILGAGSFGTALSIVVAQNADEVCIWSHSLDIIKDMETSRVNSVYMPGILLPENIHASGDLEFVMQNADIVLSVIPTQATREVWKHAVSYLPENSKIVVASKGIECNTHLLLSEVLIEVVGNSFQKNLFFLSGPSFAREIALKLPTAITIACYDPDAIAPMQEIFLTDFIRTYGSSDVIGVQLGGALKNIIAIAVGISDGLGMGNNSRAALITRGLAEIARLGKVMGADPITFMGLSGLGDLVLTCTGDLSRNRSVGIKIGQGQEIGDIQKNMRMVAEGVTTTKSAYELSIIKGVSMPITHGVYQILYENRKPSETIRPLMARQIKLEKD
ncbi:MAG: NAD(P)-dependent glycerol-3-phosphate dehydrogenase [Spirochaetia bacterium]|nr:NAD(P)-dependent glycerol-3-phosphate dehydrogenase [Spirochaetia bacterium]